MKNRPEYKNMPTWLRNTLVFLCAILICTAVFVLVTLFFFRSSFFDRSSTSSVLYVDVKPPEPENVMVVQRNFKSGKESARRFWLIGFNFEQAEISVTAFLPETLIQTYKRTDTLSGHYDYSGILNSKGAIEDLLDIKINYYAEVSKPELISIIDRFSGIVFDLDKNISYTEPDSNISITLVQGQQNLVGNQVMALLDYPDYSGGSMENLNLQQNLLKVFFNQAINEKNISFLESNYIFILNQMSTNLAYADFHTWKSYFYIMAEKRESARSVQINGSFIKYNENKVFEIAQESIKELNNVYG